MTHEYPRSDKPQKNESGWSAEMEIKLFAALRYFKPIGINKHFNMMFIYEKLHRSIPTPVLWAKLATLYDLQALDESEGIPFPNNMEDFYLPQEFYPEEALDEIWDSSEETKEHSRHTSGSSTRSAKDSVSNNSRKSLDKNETRVSRLKDDVRNRTRQNDAGLSKRQIRI